ncbi:sodium-dependent glucose transporter 1-like [Haliotis asinina]|uniref:sodium-dependent glucose transporter 1-like n=1 Tax=Haliotis asinina TaxID=109174 RepID=UPI0035323D17
MVVNQRNQQRGSNSILINICLSLWLEMKKLSISRWTNGITNANRIIYTTVLFGAAYTTMTQPLIGVTLPDIQCLLGVDLKTTSSLLLSYGLGMCCSNLTGHFIKDRVDTFLLLTTILVLHAVVIAAVPTSPFLWLTMFLILVAGWCTGTCVLVRTLHCFAIWPDNVFGVFVVQSGSSFSTITFPLVSNLFRHTRQDIGAEESFGNATKIHSTPGNRCISFNNNTEYLYILVSGLSLFVAASVMCCYKTFLKEGDSMEVLPPRQRSSSASRSTSPLIVCLIMCLSFSCSVCLAPFQELFVTYGVHTQLNLSLRVVSVMYSAYSVSIFLSRICGIFLSVRVKLDLMMLFFVLLAGVTSVLFLIFKDTSIIMMWANCLLYAVGIGPLFPGLLAWIKKYSGGSARLLNAVLLFANAGISIGPAFCGLMMGIFGNDAFIYVVSGVGLLQCVLFVYLPYHNCKRKDILLD